MCLSITSSPILPSTAPSSAISSCAAPPRVRAPFFSTGVRFCGHRIPPAALSGARLFREAQAPQPHMGDGSHDLAMAQPPFTSEHRGKHIYNVRRFLEDIREWGWPRSPPADLFRGGDFPPPKRHLPKPLPPDVDALLMEGLEERTQLSQPGTPPGAQDGLARRGALPPREWAA